MCAIAVALISPHHHDQEFFDFHPTLDTAFPSELLCVGERNRQPNGVTLEKVFTTFGSDKLDEYLKLVANG